VPEYNAPDRFRLLGDDLLRRGHTLARIEKLLGGNFARVIKETLP
jgi:membrane dipeptidase